MKKVFIVFAVALGMLLTSCNKCSNGTKVINEEESTIEMVNQNDWNAMFAQYDETRLCWYECDMKLVDFLDAECNGEIEDLVNVYQVIIPIDSTSYNTWVYKIQHFKGHEAIKDSTQGFWIEDAPLDINEIKISYREAYDKVMAVNLPKPHSRYVTLRNPLGPIAVNPQYVFGNVESQIWVDAVTGEISESNPAFPPMDEE